jgi:hypothetical protein
MDFSSAKTGSMIENGTAAGIGFLAFVNAATSKFAPNYKANNSPYPVWGKRRIEDAIACIISSPNMKAIDSTFAGNDSPTAFALHPLAAFNTTTFTGIGVLAADWAIKEVMPNKYYKSIPMLPDLVKGAGIGLLVGGIIGGIFDPAPSGYTAVSPSPVTGQLETGGVATGNVPYGRAGSTSKIYGNGSVLA